MCIRDSSRVVLLAVTAKRWILTITKKWQSFYTICYSVSAQNMATWLLFSSITKNLWKISRFTLTTVYRLNAKYVNLNINSRMNKLHISSACVSDFQLSVRSLYGIFLLPFRLSISHFILHIFHRCYISSATISAFSGMPVFLFSFAFLNLPVQAFYQRNECVNDCVTHDVTSCYRQEAMRTRKDWWLPHINGTGL